MKYTSRQVDIVLSKEGEKSTQKNLLDASVERGGGS